MIADIIITSFDRLRYLQRLVREIETWGQIGVGRICVADGGSADGTLDWLRERGISWYRQMGAGFRAAENRNRASELGESPWLIFLDAECVPSEDLTSFLERIPTGHVGVGRPIFCDEGSLEPALQSECRQVHRAAHAIPENKRNAYGRSQEGQIGTWGPIRTYADLWSCYFIIRREDFMSVGGFDGSFVSYGDEGTDLGRALSVSGLQGVLLPRCVYHLWHPEYGGDRGGRVLWHELKALPDAEYVARRAAHSLLRPQNDA